MSTILLFSAARPESLKAMVKKHNDYLVKHPESLSDIAYTLAERRERLKYRGFCVVDDTNNLAEPVPVACPGIDQAAFVFTGQGAQWTHMGRHLLMEYPSVLDNIQSMDKILQSLKDHAPSWSIQGQLMNWIFSWIILL